MHSGDRREQLLTALEIADEVDPSGDRAAFRAELRAAAQDPALTGPQLGSLESALLTEFQESFGPHVDAFWDGLAEAGLPYRRADLVRKVMCRGHLRSMEYDAFADGLEHLQTSGQITANEALALASFLDDYEVRHPDEFEDD